MQEVQDVEEQIKNLTKEIQMLKEEIASIKETLYLLSIPGMREKILEGGQAPIEECSEKIDW